MARFLLVGEEWLIGTVPPSILSHLWLRWLKMHGYFLTILFISYNDQNQSYHPAKYLHVAMDMPTWVLRASVYTAPESIDSIVASSSLSLRSVRVINLSLFIINLSLFTIKIISFFNHKRVITTAVWCKGLSELSCPILESFNILCNLWSKIIHLRKSGLHIDIVVESM